MGKFQYTPDKDQRVHEEGAIRLICQAFQSHENGLPEWLKNSSDAYVGDEAPEAKRVAVLIFDYGRRGVTPSISCLDFCGMTSARIENNFRVWADPEAAIRGISNAAMIQGGHGNGGKCYMTQMFAEYSLLHTVKNNKGNRYGVASGSVKFGYIPDPEQGRDFSVPGLRDELEQVLKPIRSSISGLPKAAVEVLKLASGFTLITGVGPKGYSDRIPVQELVANLQEHPQMIRTLEMCKVYVVVNGDLFNRGGPLTLPAIVPIPGAEKPRVIPIPVSLKDPVTGREVSTTDGDKLPPGNLTLKTSAVRMSYSKRGRHNIVYKAKSGYIGYVSVSELDIQSPYRDRIYGECFLENLEAFKQNERARLANSPLTRAIEEFISDYIQAYAKEFEARERRQYNQEEKNAISKINEALDRWKNRFLNDLLQGLWGAGEGPGPDPHPRLPTGKPVKLELSLSHHKAGLGVALRPVLKFFDDAGRRVRAVPFRWISEDNNVAMVDEDLMVINTFSPGHTTIYAELIKGKLCSNKAPLEVARIQDITLSPRDLQISVGSRHKLTAVCQLATGEKTDDVYLIWTESNPNVARVSSSGLVFGFAPGETEITAGDDRCLAKEPCMLRVVESEGKGPGDQKGKGYPLVKVSGEFDVDPETHEYVHFSREDPPVAQRPQDVDRNIWWINSASPLARLYLDKSKNYGYESREWRMYHLERYIDVIVQIALTNGPTEKESLSASDWIMKWGAQVAEIQVAAASDLSEFIATGDLPVA